MIGLAFPLALLLVGGIAVWMVQPAAAEHFNAGDRVEVTLDHGTYLATVRGLTTDDLIHVDLDFLSNGERTVTASQVKHLAESEAT